jgi:uncharacterized protein (TIRG00374 family)
MADIALTRPLPASRSRRWEFGLVLSIVVFAVLVAAASAIAGLDGVLAQLARLDAGLIATLLALSLVNYALRVWRWHHFTTAIGAGVPLARDALYYVAGFALTTTPGKAGEALRIWFLERGHGVAYTRGAPLFFADRLSDLAVFMALCLAGLFAFLGTNYAPFAGVFVALGAAILALLARPRATLALINRVWGLAGRRWPRLFGKLRQGFRQMSHLLSPRVFGGAFVIGLVGWIAEVYGFWLLLDHLGTGVTPLQATFVFAFSVTAGALALLPGGIGGTEVVMVALLSLLGVDPEVAIAATAVVRVATLWFAMLLGFVALPVTMRLMRRGG